LTRETRRRTATLEELAADKPFQKDRKLRERRCLHPSGPVTEVKHLKPALGTLQ
jgi:hypothetical protein